MNSRNTTRLIGAAGAAALGVAAGLAIGGARRAAAKAVMTLTGDWEKQLKAEHRAVKKLLRSMVDTGIEDAPKRAALVAAVGDLLSRHALEEENVIYPALRSAGMAEATHTQLDEHADMRALLRELEELSPEDPLWEGAAKRLKKLVYRHVRVEEQELFPALHDGAFKGETDRLTQLVRREGLRIS